MTQSRGARRPRDEDAVVVVFTDGEEKASHAWFRRALFERIEGLKARGFCFVFLGANQDSYAEAGGWVSPPAAPPTGGIPGRPSPS